MSDDSGPKGAIVPPREWVTVLDTAGRKMRLKIAAIESITEHEGRARVLMSNGFRFDSAESLDEVRKCCGGIVGKHPP
ncbi:hypothetical protein SAMN05519104_7550 [Rhizobiales bacterium GAS188]|nr:hypothetical protein SAMN05519104_7550 [Rhizobiales bacterium GAS188]